MNRIILLSILMLGLLTSCFESTDEPVVGRIVHMDIDDAVTLYIAPPGSSQARRVKANASDYYGGVLFKITEDGVIKQVTYTNQFDKEVTEYFTPINICIVEDSPYFFVKFTNGTYMVNKTTGAVYEAPDVGNGDAMIGGQNGDIKFSNEKTIKADKKGNIYYKSGSTVRKIDVTDVNLIKDESLTPAEDDVSMYVVSNNGELLYRIYRDGDCFHRLRTTSGRLIPIDISCDYTGHDYLAFRGFDGNIHVFDRRAISIIKFTDDDSFEVEDIITDNCRVHTMTCLSNTAYFMGYYPFLVKLPDRYLVINYEGRAMVLDSKNDRSLITCVTYDVTGGMKISSLQYNDSYVYCCGQRDGKYSLLRINPYTYEYEAILRDNNYEIYSFVVKDDNTITFTGLRLSDGKSIIANIDGNGNVDVLDEVGGTSITLNRIQ